MAKRKRNSEAPITIKHGQLEYIGYSRAGFRTHVACPQLDLVFDLGGCSQTSASCKRAFVTHVHMDHALGVIRHIGVRDLQNLRRSKIYVPAEHADLLIEAVDIWDRLENRSRHAKECIIPVSAGDELTLGKGLTAHVLRVRHTIGSVAYRLTRTKKRLKDEYRSLTGPEIGELVRSGTDVNQYEDENLVTYIGDCTIQSLDDNPEVLQSKVLILECTYLRDDEVDLAQPRGHIHVDEIVEKVGAFQGELLILKHFSLKYSHEEIRERIDAKFDAETRAKIRLLL